MTKSITIIVRDNVNLSPTVNNYILSFTKLGYSVNCICSTNKGASIKTKANFFEIGYGYSKNPIIKIYNYFMFGRKVKSLLNKDAEINNSELFWVARIDTALCLFNILESKKTILGLHELHDSYFFWKKVTSKVIRYYSSVVYNEDNRAQIGRCFYKLSKLPYVIPNKPSFHPRVKNLDILNDDISTEIYKIKDKFIIIYQGSLQADRDILPLVEATALLSDEYCLVIMGKDPHNRISEFKKINKNLVYFPWVVPPDHLGVTSYASLGVAFYDTDCLNSIYCAPNKIWEYSGFSIPVLGQNIPGLVNTVEKNEFGICVDINDIKSIVNSINKISDNYEYYSNNATEFYDSVSFDNKVKLVLDSTI